MRHTRGSTRLSVAVLVTLAWGALAFGGVYPWAFTPLLVACAAIAGGTVLVHAGGSRVNTTLAVALGAASATVLLQLLPLPREALVAISPATDRLLQDYDLAYAAALATGGASHALSISPTNTWLGLAFLGVFGLLLVGLARVLTRDDLTRLAAGVTILGALLGIIGIVQKATFTGKIYGFWTPLMGGSPFGPFVNKHHFAGWMLMGLPMALGLFCRQIARAMRGVKPGWRNRLLWFASSEANQTVLVAFAIVVMGLALVLTLSRSGITCFAVVVVIAGWLIAGRRMVGGRRAVAGGYLAFVAVVVVMWAGLDSIAARFAEPGARDLSGRFPIWADTARIVRDFPLTGTGLNTYTIATLFYQTTIPEAHLREAHNDYLQLAAEGGLLLGVPIVVTVVVFVREVSRRFRDRSDEATVYWIRVGAVTGLVAIALQSVGEFSLQMPGNAALFTVLCAIAIHESRPHESKHGPA